MSCRFTLSDSSIAMKDYLHISFDTAFTVGSTIAQALNNILVMHPHHLLIRSQLPCLNLLWSNIPLHLPHRAGLPASGYDGRAPPHRTAGCSHYVFRYPQASHPLRVPRFALLNLLSCRRNPFNYRHEEGLPILCFDNLASVERLLANDPAQLRPS